MATKKNTTKGVKKGAKRGPYNKKKNTLQPAEKDWELVAAKKVMQDFGLPEPKPKQILEKELAFDEELEQLREVCTILNNWIEEQKARNIRFIVSKFSDYFNKP